MRSCRYEPGGLGRGVRVLDGAILPSNMHHTELEGIRKGAKMQAILRQGRCRALVRQERPALSLPASVWAQGWGVDGKSAVQGPEQVLHDWGRSVHRVALTHRRLLSIADGQICFRYRDSQAQRWQTMILPAEEVIRRFLPQVWPQGCHHVRDDGRWRPVDRPLPPQLRRCLAGHAPAVPLESPHRERQPPA
jgi:hypothetical protein